ncbi:MAG: LysR family transcriptional regulator [Myxococcota bacterium]
MTKPEKAGPSGTRSEASRVRDQVWAWLPAFHAVSELGTTVQAGKSLGLSAAAISRSVRLLEDRLGQPLFHRVGRSLRLNEAGGRLREATRTSVLAVDDALRAIDPTAMARPLRVASLGLLTEHFVVPAMLDACGPQLAEHLNLRPVDALQALRRHDVDLAFYYEELVAEGLRVLELGLTSKSVYCGRAHPLYGVKRPALSELLGHPFSVPQVGDSGQPMDGWPSHLERRVGMRVTMLRSNLQVALSGRFLTVLPDVTAAPDVSSLALWRLSVPKLDPIRLLCAMRPEDRRRSDVKRVLGQVQRRVKAEAQG